jgi:broad specificity phosphatase PhoE
LADFPIFPLSASFSQSSPPVPKHPPATRLLSIRHVEVEPRYQGTFGGCINMDLSPHGCAQAEVLAKYLHGKTLDAIYASPMKRAQQTAAPLLKKRRAGADHPARIARSGFRRLDGIQLERSARKIRRSSLRLAR